MSDSSFYGLLVLTSGRTAQPNIYPELHLNLWERGKYLFFESAFLDIGIMLDVSDTAQTVEFVLPWSVKKEDLEDLSDRVLEQGAVPAIFNEIWVVSGTNGSAGFVTNPLNNSVFTVVRTNSDLHVHEHNPNTQQSQFSIQLNVPSIKTKSISACPTATRMYVRFRVKNVPTSFYRVSINPRDRIFLSSWQRTEIIDFRMNVRRGTPLGLDTNIGATFADFSKVHLFLMKSRDQDIVFEDKLFRSCRSLEDEEFWANYSIAHKASDVRRFFSKRHVKDSLGYQWTRVSQKDTATNVEIPVREFATLARFKKVRFGLFSFIFAAAVVGSGGNAVWDAIKMRYGETDAAVKLQNFISIQSEKPEGTTK